VTEELTLKYVNTVVAICYELTEYMSESYAPTNALLCTIKY